MPLVALVILDGFGLAPPGPGNAVELARTPVFDDLWARFPHTTLAASGRAVGPAGRPDGQLRGRAPHDRRRPAPAPGPRAPVRRGRRRHVRRQPGAGGRCAPGEGRRQPAALDGPGLRRRRALPRRPPPRAGRHGAARGRVAHVHAITDGRDVSPHQAAGLLATLEAEWADGAARFATVCGRIYAMDRDSRWERTRAVLPRGRGRRRGRGDRAPRGGRRRVRGRRHRRVRRAGRDRPRTA